MKPGVFALRMGSVPLDRLFGAGVVLLAMAPWLVVTAGLDDRSVFGRSPWDKPLRFALSLGVYAITLACAAQWLRVRTWVPGWRWVSTVVLVALVFEMSWILVQAARGVDSHFNERTAFEALMFSLMGLGAALLSLAVLWLGLVASWLAVQSVVPRDRLMASGLALGFVVTGLLLPWTGEALVDVGRSQSAFHAHLMVPLLGWRLDGSDPRPAHFVAAHFMQLLPAAAYLLARFLPGMRLWVAGSMLGVMAVGGILLTLHWMP